MQSLKMISITKILNNKKIQSTIVQLLPRALSSTTSTKTAANQLINVKVDDKTGIAQLTLQRAPVNGLNLDLINEFNKNLNDLTKAKCRGMILCSASPTVFSAGLDIMEMYKPDMERARQFWSSLQDLWINLNSTVFPTAAAITGHSPAGGCLLAMSCEYRVMAPNFTIGLNETQLGLVAPTWFRDSMLNTISKRQTELALTSGRLFNTDEALQVGLIDEIGSNKDEIIDKCIKFINTFKNINPMVRVASKLSLRQPMIESLQKIREADLNGFLQHISNPKVQQMLEFYLKSLKK